MRRLQQRISDFIQTCIGYTLGTLYACTLIAAGLLAVLWYEIQERLTPKNKKSC